MSGSPLAQRLLTAAWMISERYSAGCSPRLYRRKSLPGVERVKSAYSYEPWQHDALTILMEQGQPHIVRPALVATYTGQRRGDVLASFRDDLIDGTTWYLKQGKT
jgi:hypothetical protein